MRVEWTFFKIGRDNFKIEFFIVQRNIYVCRSNLTFIKMKKAILLGALGVFALASCKKDYTCTCKVNEQSIKIPLTDYKKKDAEDACDAAKTTYSNADANTTCTLD